MNKRGFAPIVIIGSVVLIVVVGALGYFLSRKAVAPQQQASMAATSTVQTPTNMAGGEKCVPSSCWGHLGCDYYNCTNGTSTYVKFGNAATGTVATTITEDSRGVTVDFGQCVADQKRIFVPFGSTVIDVVGPQGGDICLIKYGGEVENPNWDGQLPFSCSVPRSLGAINFLKGQIGVDMSPIQKYCK